MGVLLTSCVLVFGGVTSLTRSARDSVNGPTALPNRYAVAPYCGSGGSIGMTGAVVMGPWPWQCVLPFGSP